MSVRSVICWISLRFATDFGWRYDVRGSKPTATFRPSLRDENGTPEKSCDERPGFKPNFKEGNGMRREASVENVWSAQTIGIVSKS